MSTEDRVAELERSFVAVTQLLTSQSERSDTHGAWINQLGATQAELSAAQAETERKIAALVDAQINTEDKLGRLETAVGQLVEKVDGLADVQARTDARLDRLIGVVERLAERGGGSE